MIYIDPPYNTGHDFVYKDNFEDNIANYKEITGQAQKSNADTDGRYHTNWLNMMYPRLKLARTLLAKEGVIFISIDDNEVDNLKKVCNDIFGEDNFVANMIITSAPAGTQSSNDFAVQQSYCLVYRKSAEFHTKNITLTQAEIKEKYSHGTDEKGSYYIERLWKRGVGGKMEDVPSLHFPVWYNVKTKEILIDKEIDGHNENDYVKIIPYQTAGVLGRWTWSREKMINERDYLTVELVAGEYKLHKKVYSEQDMGRKPYTIVGANLGRTELGSLEIKNIFNNKVFDYPKYSGFVKYLSSLIDDKEGIFLDFFSGSATTAHAIMQLNAEDGGHRKFICVQLPEATSEDSEAYKAGYKNICEIGEERIRRVGSQLVASKKQEIQEEIQKYQKLLADKTKTELLIRQDEFELTQNDKDIKNAMEYDKNSLNLLLNKNNNKLEAYWDRKEKLTQQTDELEQSKTTLFELQEQLKNLEANADLDTGFKVFKLDSSNLRKWNNEPTDDVDEVAKRLQLSLEYLEPNRTDFDLVYEIMLKHGIDLSKPVVKTANAKGYIVEDDDYKLLICAYKNLTLEDIERFVNENVGTYIFADHCFADDNLLINTQEMLKARNKEMKLF